MTDAVYVRRVLVPFDKQRNRQTKQTDTDREIGDNTPTRLQVRVSSSRNFMATDAIETQVERGWMEREGEG